MFQTKTKIFAASVLGVSLLLVASLVSLTVYLVTNSNPAYDGSWLGYITGGNYDESYKMSQQLLNDKLVQHALVLPTFLHSKKRSPGQTVSVSTASHMLLIQTSAESIPSVKAAVHKASRESYPQKVWTAVFSAVAKGTPYLSFALPTAGTGGSPSPNSALLPASANSASGNLASANSAGVSSITMNIDGPGSADINDAVVGKPFVIQFIGARKRRHIWTRGAETSPHFKLEFVEDHEEREMMDESPYYLKVTPTAVGRHTIRLNYLEPRHAPSACKFIYVTVFPK